jgi:hypothetical protein
MQTQHTRQIRVATFAIALQLLSHPTFAEEPLPPPPTQKFGGITLGIGLGLNFNVSKQQRVESAIVVPPNNIVRVTETSDAIASIVLESHYFFVPKVPFWFGDVPAGDWGHGPFVAIQAGSDQVVGFALGWMIGLRERYWQDKNGWHANYSATHSWNFGVGVRVDPKAQVLGDGIVANSPLPPGETTVRFNHVPRYGILLVSSYSF